MRPVWPHAALDGITPNPFAATIHPTLTFPLLNDAILGTYKKRV